MLISVLSSKGGVGTSSVAALFAKGLSLIKETLLIDACNGDLHAICCIEDAQYSFEDWSSSEQPSAKTLKAISKDIDSNLSCVPSSRVTQSATIVAPTQANIVEEILKTSPGCVLDFGTQQSQFVQTCIEASDLVVLVLRQCYLSFLAVKHNPYLKNVDVIVVIKEPGRSISVSKIAEVLNVNCVVEINAQKDFARTIDAGVLVQRPPKQMIEPINALLSDFISQDELVIDAISLREDIFGETKRRNEQSFWEDVNENRKDDFILASPFLLEAKRRAGEII